LPFQFAHHGCSIYLSIQKAGGGGGGGTRAVVVIVVSLKADSRDTTPRRFFELLLPF